MKVYDKESKQYIEEKESNQKSLNFLYNTVCGRVLLKCIFARPYFSKLRSRYYHSALSIKKIRPFIEEYSVDVSAWDIEAFRSFNDFFERKKEITLSTDKYELPSVADARLSVYAISDNLFVDVKHSTYSLDELVDCKMPMSEYKDGNCLVFRLSLEDYHRYIYPDNGCIKHQYTIDGELHTVRPISSKYRVFSRNKRVVSILTTEHFGNVVMIEVGAMLVGGIVNSQDRRYLKGQEKGHFEYGGSTIIMLTNNSVEIDDDIKEQSALGYETKVKIGSTIGRFKA